MNSYDEYVEALKEHEEVISIVKQATRNNCNAIENERLNFFIGEAYKELISKILLRAIELSLEDVRKKRS